MTADEIAAAVQNGQADCMELWEAVRRFAAQHSNRWVHIGRGGITLEDLEQSAFVALLRAVKTWDPNGKAGFLGWYKLHIKGEFSIITGQRSMRTKMDPLDAAVSLDIPVNDSEEASPMLDLLPDESPSTQELLEKKACAKLLAEALDTLSPQQRAAVVDYYVYRRRTDRAVRAAGIRKLRSSPMYAQLRGYL